MASNGGEPGIPKHMEGKDQAHGTMFKYVVSMALRAALELGLPDIIETTKGGQPLTAEEIMAHLPTKSSKDSPDYTRNLKRTLKLLVWEGLFTQSFNDKQEAVYGPTVVSKWFLKDNEMNLLPSAEWHMNQTAVMDSFRHVPAAILDDHVVPFELQHGMTVWEYAGKHPEFSAAFQGVMVTHTNRENAGVLEAVQRSGVLEGVATLVDVGGGTGKNIAGIIGRNPHIKGINYDLPFVIAKSPQTPGVTNLGGNMFESVPHGEAIILKWILHDYGDSDATRILKNCFEALPKKGKLIVVENILVEDPKNQTPKAKAGAYSDYLMHLLFKGGRERTRPEYERLVTAAGFPSPQIVLEPISMDLIIAVKE